MTEPNQVPVVDSVPVDFTANKILLSFTRLTEHRGANSLTTRWHRGVREEPWSSRCHSLTDNTNTNILINKCTNRKIHKYAKKYTNT